jgi:hypothetical protein
MNLYSIIPNYFIKQASDGLVKVAQAKWRKLDNLVRIAGELNKFEKLHKNKIHTDPDFLLPFLLKKEVKNKLQKGIDPLTIRKPNSVISGNYKENLENPEYFNRGISEDASTRFVLKRGIPQEKSIGRKDIPPLPENNQEKRELGEYLFRGSKSAQPYKGGYFNESFLHGSPHRFVAELYGDVPSAPEFGNIVHKFKTRPNQALVEDYAIDDFIARANTRTKGFTKRYNVGDDISDFKKTWETPISKSKHLYAGTIYSDHLGNSTFIPPGDFKLQRGFKKLIDNMNEGAVRNPGENRNPYIIRTDGLGTMGSDTPGYKEEVLRRLNLLL